LSELDKKVAEMLHPEIQKTKRIIGRLEPNFIDDNGRGLVQSVDLGCGRRKESQNEFDYMAKDARSKMGMMTSPARSARLGTTDVDPGDLMSQASGLRWVQMGAFCYNKFIIWDICPIHKQNTL
jgi:hypothetical protein